MILTDKKEVLKEIIEDADDKLMSLMIALANEYNYTEREYTQDEIQEFYRIRDEMLEHPETSLTPEQAHESIRNKKR